MAEVYGEAYIETGRDKIVALLTTLIGQMTAVDPAIAAVHDGHHTVMTSLPAVSVDLADHSWAGTYAPELIADTDIAYTIRVHTGYTGDINDGVKQMRLINSITNKLAANHDLGGGYRLADIADITSGTSFDASATVGAEFTAIVKVTISHTQE